MNRLQLFAAASCMIMSAACLAPVSALAQTGSSALEEIVVTAQKRSENAQDVAATVSVIGSEALTARGVTDLRGVTSFAPMLNMSQQNVVTQVFIRGIGQPSDAETNDPAVATNMDGVYTPRYTLSSSMFDVERVEVLSGPQGTLYGRNAAGGAVNITTKTPTLGEYLGEGLIELGNYDLVHLFAAANIPLGEDLAFRVAVDSNNRDGYMSNGQNAADVIAVRGTALYQPTDALSLLLRGEYQKAGGPGDSIVLRPLLNPDDPWYQPTIPGETFHLDRTVYKTNAELNYSFGDSLTLTYIPAFVYYDFTYRTPIGYPVLYYPNPLVAGNPLAGFAGALANLGDTGRQFTNELRLSGETERFKWVVGLYNLRHTAKGPGVTFDIYNPAVFRGGAFQPYAFRSGAGQSYQSVKTDSSAIFGQGTYSLTDRFRLTLGARYSDDERTASGLTQSLIPIANSAGPAIRYNLKLADDRVDWKVGAEYDLTDTSMLYASIQTGYIGGGFNVAAVSATASTFKPEELLAYTVGAKNTFLDNTLRLNVEAFFYQYDDLQVSAFSSATGSSLQFNVPKSEIYGVQLEMAYRPWPNTTIDANIGYLHAEITEGRLPPSAVYACGVPGVAPVGLCAGTNIIDYAGYSLPNSPEWSGSVAATQEWDLSSGAVIEGRASANFESDAWALFSHIKGLDKPAYAKADASLTYRAPDDRWSAGVWIKNIANTAHLVTPSTTNVYGLNTWFIDPPRTYGVRIGYRFQ